MDDVEVSLLSLGVRRQMHHVMLSLEPLFNFGQFLAAASNNLIPIDRPYYVLLNSYYIPRPFLRIGTYLVPLTSGFQDTMSNHK